MIVFEAQKRKTTIEPKSDAQGRYFLGKYEQTLEPHESISRPDHTPPYTNESSAAEHLSTQFVSTRAASKLTQDLAPLKALRALGPVPRGRLAEFGLEASKAKVIVKFRNGERTLELGDVTPGGANRYAREPQKREVYVLSGDLIGDLEAADVRLPDRELHSWSEHEPTRARISAAGKQRTLVRGGEETNRFWADAASASQKDETSMNWLTKIDRLRVASYDATPPKGRVPVVRIEYAGMRGESAGFFELWKGPGPENTLGYWVVTEATRLTAMVLQSQGEEIERDLRSILK
jgi:hypothetical protein